MAMLLLAPVFRANPSFLGTSPSSWPNSSSILRNSPIIYAQFPSSLRRPVTFGEEKPQEPGIQDAFGASIRCHGSHSEELAANIVQLFCLLKLDDVESGAGVDSVKASEAGSSDVSEANADITTCLQLYKEALENNDETKLAEIEALFKSIEDAKDDLEKKVISLSEELTVEKIRVLRISADFDNFRKSTETERLSLVTNAQGELVENLLPVLDSFERAKTRIKVATEGEEKINNSYQSIYKQFAEILASVDVVPVPVETMVQNRVGLNPIDQLFGKMLQLLNHSFFRIYIVAVMFVTFAILSLFVG